MDSGIYLNLFTVSFDDTPVDMMIASCSGLPSLRELRATLQNRSLQADIYQIKGQVYGYGANQSLLVEWGFAPTSICIGDIPQFAARLILEGFVTNLVQAGYTLKWNKHGASVYQLGIPLLPLNVGVNLYRGFDLQSIYLNNPETNELFYAIVIDAVFTYRDKHDQALRPDAVVARFGNNVLNTLLTKQGDLTKSGQINLEVARRRLLDQTLPFVRQRGTFMLPGGIVAQLAQEPLRVTLVGNEEGV